ncbi:phosphatase PAP2 family protein [Bifidobacterium sp.]|jgi:membrane-associated phospholipid phosphatase|uniref:phosphatase PAP2 family protein n=1 Tax=Bifidobacterium sp. TaxID=41200 RepID=UPI0025BD950C|nr:phosphatase PAP2 family protein [Bifidobacterium sp.]MCH4209072.1 phosphatase PAP2 family protein [Bifidobacterium sp.]MCI1225404.1 phosphatase PAP2 family protein [Bifidobacterium sp.]
MSEETEPEVEQHNVAAGAPAPHEAPDAASDVTPDQSGGFASDAADSMVSDADDDARNSSRPEASMPIFMPLDEPAALHDPAAAAAAAAQADARARRDGDDFAGLTGLQRAHNAQFPQPDAIGSDADGAAANKLDNDLDGDLDRGLARLDPLAVRPRISSRILCVAFALLFAILAAGAWWLGVCTMNGQNYDETVYTDLGGFIASWLRPVTDAFTNSKLVIALSVAVIAAAALVAAVRRRWWLLGQLAVIGALFWAVHYLKYLLPRPFIGDIVSSQKNSAPSGHTLLAAAAGILLLIAVARAWRALAAVLSCLYAVLVGLSVIVGGWHRPTDVVMAILLAGAVGLLVLACTRASGMDAPGERASSPSVQIVASVMITLGVLGGLYAGYIIWQIEPGLALSERWIHDGAVASALVLIAASSALVFGLTLVMRQLTASPLSKFGLVGAPPAPPELPLSRE